MAATKKFGRQTLNKVMRIFTNKAAAEALDIPVSTWGWHKRRGTIPTGSLRVGHKWLYTERQLEGIATLLRLASYTRGKPGRKKEKNSPRP